MEVPPNLNLDGSDPILISGSEEATCELVSQKGGSVGEWRSMRAGEHAGKDQSDSATSTLCESRLASETGRKERRWRGYDAPNEVQ